MKKKKEKKGVVVFAAAAAAGFWLFRLWLLQALELFVHPIFFFFFLIKKHNPLPPVCVHACLHACMMSKQKELDLTDIGKKLANAQSKEALMNLLPVILPKSFLLSFLERTQFSFPEHTNFLTAITKFFLSLMLLFVVSISRVPVIPSACWLLPWLVGKGFVVADFELNSFLEH